MSNAIDLALLPAPDIVETLDFETIVSCMTADLVARDPTLATIVTQESEPIVKLIEVCAYREVGIRQRVNDAASAVMLAFATGTTLDNIVANLGVQRLAGETDAALLARAVEAPDSWSVAGPEGAYEYLASSASPLVADAAATSPTPGAVEVVILSTAADGVADDDLIATVTAAFGDDVRPMTDYVTVISGSVTNYEVDATLYIASGLDSSVVEAAATTAVQAYAAARRFLNKGVAVAGVNAALMAPGVENLVTTSPGADIEASPTSAPNLTTVNLTIVVGGDGV